MASGEQKKILLAVNQSHPELIQQAFGAKSGELLKLMTGTREFQKQGRMNIRYRMGPLAEPWRSRFARFGLFQKCNSSR